MNSIKEELFKFLLNLCIIFKINLHLKNNHKKFKIMTSQNKKNKNLSKKIKKILNIIQI